MHCEPCQGLFQDEDAVSQHNFGTVDGRAFMSMQLTYKGSCYGTGDVFYNMYWDGTQDCLVQSGDNLLCESVSPDEPPAP
jgi:hypothetical protein